MKDEDEDKEGRETRKKRKRRRKVQAVKEGEKNRDNKEEKEKEDKDNENNEDDDDDRTIVREEANNYNTLNTHCHLPPMLARWRRSGGGRHSAEPRKRVGETSHTI